MFFKNSLVLLFLFFGFSVNAFAGLCKVTYANDQYFYAGVQVGDTVNFSAVKLSGHTVAGPCELKRKRSTVLMGSPVPSCPSGTSLVDGKCESLCKQMEGQSLGTVTFPEGTRDVASLCRNSCKAKSDLFFPAGNPPYGVFTYTGDSCDGSESSGGDTDGGDTGGGDTGGGDTDGGDTDGGDTDGGDTGGGDTGGGDTGGGDTGGGDTGGGDTGGGLTKGDIKDVLQDVFGKSESFTAPGQGNGFAADTVLTTSLDDLKTEIDELEETLESKLKQSPLKLGQMSFSDGSYDGTSFFLSRWDVDVGFNLFSTLGSTNSNMIRTVILFIATLLAGFILLSSGRSKV